MEPGLELVAGAVANDKQDIFKAVPRRLAATL